MRVRARSGLVMRLARHCPAFDARTRHGRLSASSASAYVPSSSHQNSRSKRWRSVSACARSAPARSGSAITSQSAAAPRFAAYT
jgi:hypothetical protein